jgi:hypothetical protein
MSEKETYIKPLLIKHGDLKDITQAKITGGIDGQGPGYQDSLS